MHNFYGKHVLADLEEIPTDLVNNVNDLILHAKCSISNANATLIEHKSYMFFPHGYTIFFILKESHVSIHSYPEFNSMFIDAFTCGNKIDPYKIISDLADYLCPNKINVSIVERGNILYRNNCLKDTSAEGAFKSS